jgi:ribosomal protein L11 methylase PrmA
MLDLLPETGSFRDPSGHVYVIGQRVFRTVMPSAAADYEFVRSTGLVDRLVRDGLLLPETLVRPESLGPWAASAAYVVEHPTIPYVSYPYEWCFSALKVAALLHLDIHLRALEKGVTLSDASAYNIQYQGPKPVFIDHLSFRRYRDGEFWAGHRQFCEQFLNPLLLRSKVGLPHNPWYRGSLEGITASDLNRLLSAKSKLSWRVFFHVVLQARFQDAPTNGKKARAATSRRLPLSALKSMLRSLRKWIATLEPADRGKTVWRDYAQTHSYLDPEVESKRSFVTQFVSETAPQTLFDLGCNTGDFAKAALDAGARRVIGFDFDQGALDQAFLRARSEELHFLPLFLDLANPAPSQGWAEAERSGFGARAKPDAILALALVHHLAITRNIPLESVVNWLLKLAPAGVVEFVPKQDPMVQELLRLREDIFPNYSAENFLAYIRAQAQIIKIQTVSASGRLLVWFRRLSDGRSAS